MNGGLRATVSHHGYGSKDGKEYRGPTSATATPCVDPIGSERTALTVGAMGWFWAEGAR